MNYTELVQTIENKRRFEKEYGADITARLLKEAGIEEEQAPFIHVAGTNGKGSVIAMVDSILRQAEFKVGRFTSPHLETFRERIVVDGKMISEEDVVRLGEKVLSLPSAQTATMFDISLMIAVFYFIEQECDFWLIETGLGGLHDSTNALGTPIISVITSIGLDHEAYLGNTLEEIATQKAGIIKEDSVCITGPQDETVLKVLQDTCDEKDVYLIEMEPIDDDDFELKLLGEYQKENAGIAIGIINVLVDIGVKILPSDMETGFKKAVWPGRMQRVKSGPDVILDGAHNIPGMKALAESVKKMYGTQKVHFGMAFSNDKAIEEMISLVKDVAADIVFTKANSDRAKEPKELVEIAEKLGIPASFEEDAKASVVSVKKHQTDNKPAVYTGSLYYIGELLKEFK